jgi:hypothetical protein
MPLRAEFYFISFFFCLAACSGSRTETSETLQETGETGETVDAVGEFEALAEVTPVECSHGDLTRCFDVRVPAEHQVTCSQYPEGMQPEPQDYSDVDWLCTFAYGGASGVLYLQATPTDCRLDMQTVAIYTSEAWLALDGLVHAPGAPVYDWGGNHRNDFLTFDFQGHHFRYYHSSLGYGWRKCQPMDCMQVYDASGVTLQEDGCTKERTLPVTCVQVKADGTWPALVDTFAPCPGDM